MTGDVFNRIRLVGVVLMDTCTPDIKATIDRFRGEGLWVMFVYPPMAGGFPLDGDGKTSLAVQSPRKGRRSMIRAAVRKAHTLNMTHILINPPENVLGQADINRLSTDTLNHPDAVIIGRQAPVFHRFPASRRIMRRGATFMFRLQTGINLDDPGCPVRVYPLRVIDWLKIRSCNSGLDAEILVKAAWAGVPIRQVALDLRQHISNQEKSLYSRLGPGCIRIALQVHWVMRSITPIPHRKVVDDQKPHGRKVSIWHPLQSIRALLTENLTPLKLGWAVALGVFLGTLPLIALHTVTILLAAGFFRLNKAAALAASQLCVPPVVPALCVETGFYLRHGHFLTEISIKTLGYQALERIWEWLLGAMLLAPVLSLLMGVLAYAIGQITCRRHK